MLAGSSAQSQKTNMVTITGTIVNETEHTPKVMRIHFLNPFSKVSKSVTLSSDSLFKASHEMIFAQNITVAYNNTFINLYVEPGDSVHLSVDAAKLQEKNFGWVTISGDHATLSRQLTQCNGYIQKILFRKYDYQTSPDSLLLTVKEKFREACLQVRKYIEEHSFDPLLIEWSEKDIIYSISNWISDYVTQPDISIEKKKERIHLFSDELFKTYDQRGFQTMMFPYHLQMYANWIISVDDDMVSAKANSDTLAIIQAGVNRLLKEPEGLCRDYMIFDFLQGFIPTHSAYIQMTSYENRIFSDSIAYRSLVKSLEIEKHFGSLILPEATVFDQNPVTIKKTDIIQQLSQKYPDKVILIDIYATWCAPCIKEIPFLDTLAKEFPEELVVARLCLESSYDKWLEFIGKYKSHGNYPDYFFNDDASKLFMSHYQLSGYPSYLLINRKGQLITTGIPRPSDGDQLKVFIQENNR